MAKTKHKKKLEKKAAKEVTKEVESNFCKDCKGYKKPRCKYWEDQPISVRKIKGMTHFPIFVPRKHTCEYFRSK